MDIANYVGLFLIKNEFCFLPSIGSLYIDRRPAAYNKETQQMSAPGYDVRFSQVGGSIDDSFANFIATNERISIAHAANHLKDFCAIAKAELREGKEVTIPGIGKFKGGANDTIQFTKDQDLHIEGRSIPFFKNSESVNQKKEEAISNIIERTTIREPKADEEIEYKAPSVNWGKIVMLIGIAVVIIGAGIFTFWYMNNKTTKPEPAAVVEQKDTVAQPAAAAPQEQPAPDTTKPAAQPDPAVSANGTMTYKVALNTYPTKERAESRAAKLKSYGNPVEFYAKDSANYYVVMTMTSPAADTAHIVDSLRKLFNPSGKVQIVR